MDPANSIVLASRTCAVCGGELRKYASSKSWFVLKCKGCGFGQTTVTGEDLTGFYETDYFEGNSARFSQAWDEPIPESKKWWLDRYVRGQGMNCLEIGPGPAAMVPRYLAENRREFSYSAVEVSRTVGRQLRDRGYGAYIGRIYDDDVARAVAGRFDCVVATEVIEHDLDPRRFVSGMFHALKPNGSVYLTTGNFDGLMARIRRGNWYYLDLPAHVCFYTPRSVRRLFGDVGFRNVRVDCIGFNYIRLYQRCPIPGMLSAVHRLRIPTGMTICAQK